MIKDIELIQNNVDLIINRIRIEMKEIRQSKWLSQGYLAKGLGISRQQLQKYESGKNRISIKMLMSFCLYLNIDIIKFLDKCINSHPNTDADILQKQLQLQLTLTKEKM